MLRPGAERVARLGGLHSFSNWPGPILTDSGGFQVMSLAKLRQISDRSWAEPDTVLWVLTRFGDRRYEQRGFELAGQCTREFQGRAEPFLIWTTTWAELRAHPATVGALADVAADSADVAADSADDVSVHAPEPLQVRL